MYSRDAAKDGDAMFICGRTVYSTVQMGIIGSKTFLDINHYVVVA